MIKMLLKNLGFLFMGQAMALIILILFSLFIYGVAFLFQGR